MSQPPSITYVIGDIHGLYHKLLRILRDAGLVDGRLAWTGGPARLWFMGDFFDRGPDGIGPVELVMRLQREAAEAGGNVGALLGNHDALIVAARRFGHQPILSINGEVGTFYAQWQAYSGQASDLERLTPAHEEWLTALPAMARVEDWLLIHADALLYASYGRSIDEVNEAVATVLHSEDPTAWDDLLEQFGQHGMFEDVNPEGRARAAAMLAHFGGRQIVHGHSPIPKWAGLPPERVTGARIYAGGLCVNVDGGMYLGGPGFVHRLDAPDPA